MSDKIAERAAKWWDEGARVQYPEFKQGFDEAVKRIATWSYRIGYTACLMDQQYKNDVIQETRWCPNCPGGKIIQDPHWPDRLMCEKCQSNWGKEEILEERCHNCNSPRGGVHASGCTGCENDIINDIIEEPDEVRGDDHSAR